MNGRRKRVLIVDGDELTLIELERLLEDEGIDTTTSWSMEEAMRWLRSKEFDLFLIGDNLTSISCDAAIREIQRAGLPAPVMVLESAVPRLPSNASYYISLGAIGAVRRWNLSEVIQRVAAIPGEQKRAARVA